jgi:hypothetical protein
MVSNQEAMESVESLILKFAHPNSFNKITNVNISLGNTYQCVKQFKKGQDVMEA